MGDHVRHRETVAFVERQAAHALLVVRGLAHDRLDFEQLRHIPVALGKVGQDARAVARAARAPINGEKAQVEQVMERERVGQGDHVGCPGLVRGQGRVGPGDEGHLGCLG